MAADALREIGVLLLTFAPLYKFFESSRASAIGLAITIFIALSCYFVGAELERHRKVPA
jgi:hypothetical protein